MRHLLLTFLSLFLFACSSSVGVAPTPPKCLVTYRVAIDNSFTDSQLELVLAGELLWEQASGWAVCFANYEPNPDFTVYRRKDRSELCTIDHDAECTIHAGLYGGGKIRIVTEPDWDDLYIETIAAHEFGHALGLGHNVSPDSVMFRDVNPDAVRGGRLNKIDKDALCGRQVCR